MKKSIKIALICIAVVIMFFVVCALALFGAAFKAHDKSEVSELTKTWMSYIKGDTRVVDLVIPGSHDAATEDMMWMARTQDKTIYDQLLCGTRYLDLRVRLKDDKLVICHNIINGKELSGVLDEIARFLDEYESEGIIIDFQHFYDGALERVFPLVEEKLGDKIISRSDVTPMNFIESLALDDIRGKCLIIWGSSTLPEGNENRVFVRDMDMTARENSVLHSYYETSKNNKPTNVYVGSILDEYISLFKKDGKGLFVLQGQLTDPLVIIGPRVQEATHTDNMSKFVLGLKDSEDLEYINIIMRDFVGARKNMEIVSLNFHKGFVERVNGFIDEMDAYLDNWQ